ncbi:uncharacterized protein Z520_09367 [Fonsecaea multimorphosa CBS 102226]|uniref:Uncharacterized protein n=1 Tax=Fonsecaea multimorphosa CBS 102226 TaxID=1442371 RepID=A0A0D2JNZ6_9EURO|nr:uncharacterized protein Z520_09367 [Fonsecaea multimorphosa CBS 102226]KIX95057.1 hypothetical protein Z520_09367 [Fonsecaea multimorphosa CBS 102226]OAL20701.1 hypothetical protein AYO22_08710 [Fonsecaea multimorphosa]
MPPNKETAVRFVDSHPFPSSKREQELIQSAARSHAATVSHPKYRKQAAEHTDDESSGAALPDSSEPASSIEANPLPPTRNTDAPSAQKSSRQSAKSRQKFDQHGQLFHRYRIVTQRSRGNSSREANVGRKRREVQARRDGNQLQVVPQSSIPIFKGNTDPFNTTVIPVSALEHLLLQQARAQSMLNTWPSEIALRHNHGALTAESLKKMPAFVSDKASSHAIISHAYYSSGSRLRVRGQPFEQTLVHAEKHKFQALRELQKSVESQSQAGDTAKLWKIFSSCCWLGAAEMLSGNIHAAIVHLTASKKIVDSLGGWSVVGRMEKEVLLGAVVLLATAIRSRPVLDIGDFDPGPWRSHNWATKLKDSPALLQDVENAFPETAPPAISGPTTVSPTLRAIFADIRELLAIEELKFKYATSKSPGASEIFRWSHARKVAVRARSLHYWCDLLEAAKKDGKPMTTIYAPGSVPSQVAFDFEVALCLAMRCFDRCIFEEHYQPGGVYREAKRYHAEMTAVMEALRPAAEDFSVVPSDHTQDLLWIYSIGSYVEDVFMRPELSKKEDPVLPQRRFFSTRFSYLVAANLEFGSFDDVTTFLMDNYLYYPRLQDDSLRKLIEF